MNTETGACTPLTNLNNFSTSIASDLKDGGYLSFHYKKKRKE